MTAKQNEKQKMDGILLLSEVEDRAAALAFFDPQYRTVLDKMAYGNEGNAGSRQRARANLRQMSDRAISLFMEELTRALRPSGHLMLWLDKFCVVQASWKKWAPEERRLQPVDLLHWNKARTGMGRRLRCRSEYLLIFQKPPVRAAGVWKDHRLDDTHVEQSSRAGHPHAKPVQLARRLILATTKPGDLVLDPAAGGYSVLEACRDTGRRFLGCDLLEPER